MSSDDRSRVGSKQDGRVVVRVVASFAVQLIEFGVARAKVFRVPARADRAIAYGGELWLRAALATLGLLVMVEVKRTTTAV